MADPLSSQQKEGIDAAIARHAGCEGPLLPILHDIQAEFGCIDEFAKRRVAQALNLSRAEIQGVVSFYHDFRERAEPRPVIKLCRAEACQARGVEGLVPGARAAAAGRVAIETVYCLGLCAVGPAALIGEAVHARLDAPALAALIGDLA